MSIDPSTPPRSYLFVWIGVIAAVLVAGVFVGLVLLLSRLLGTTADGLAAPEPDYPPYVEAGCSTSCLTEEQAARLVPSAEALALFDGLEPDPAHVAAPPTPIGTYVDDVHGAYFTGDGDPIVCSFALSPAPISPASPSFVSRDDVVLDLGGYAGATTTVTQFVRVFESDIYSSRYPSSLTSPIKQCAHYEYTVEGLRRTVEAYRAPLDLPTGVAGAGWIETSAEGSRVVVDLQLENLALRTVIVSAPHAELSGDDIAALVAATAEAMLALEHV
ncbi:MAG: hypothetical protein JWP85_804 [Rhodoglobus sp.]|nr:hypothetical protein [Rhodoglobus sp.]